MSMEFCSRGEISHYQNIAFQQTNYRDNPPSIDYINDKLAKLTPKGRSLVKLIGNIALVTFVLVAAIFASHFTFFTFVSVTGALIWSLISFVDYKNYRDKVNELEKDIYTLFKKFSNEFTFLEKKSTPLIPLKDDQLNLIKPYTENHYQSLVYKIREETHYKLNGGVIGMWSVTPLALEEVCKKTNAEEVSKNYKPWIDLLITLAGDSKTPEDFLGLVGKMGGFNRSPLDFTRCLWGQYTCNYRRDKKYIDCLHRTDSSKNCVIKTPEQCLTFVTQLLKGEFA